MLIPNQPSKRNKNEKSVHQLIQQPFIQKSFQPIITRPISNISKARYATEKTLNVKDKLERTDTDKNLLNENYQIKFVHSNTQS